MIDSSLLGQTAAKCMESLDRDEEWEDGRLEAVAMVVILNNREGTESSCRVFCSEEMYYRQVGLLCAGLDCVEYGERTEKDVDDDTA